MGRLDELYQALDDLDQLELDNRAELEFFKAQRSDIQRQIREALEAENRALALATRVGLVTGRSSYGRI